VASKADVAPANKRPVIAFLISCLLSMSAYNDPLDVGSSTRSKGIQAPIKQRLTHGCKCW
jgi:hypothetical protein